MLGSNTDPGPALFSLFPRGISCTARQIWVGGVPTEALFDSGSTDSVLSQAFVHRFSLPPIKSHAPIRSIQLADGTSRALPQPVY